jgi:hypothetical protein
LRARRELASYDYIIGPRWPRAAGWLPAAAAAVAAALAPSTAPPTASQLHMVTGRRSAMTVSESESRFIGRSAPLLAAIIVIILAREWQVATAAAAAVRPPPFSWDTVPVFAETSNVTGPFDARALATLKRFPVFVAEKAYDYPGRGYAEDKLTALAENLRQLNPDIFLVFYYNANLDMDDYRLNALSEAAAPTWWLRNSSGVPMVAPVDSGAGSRPPFPYAKNSLGGLHCWDHTNPAVREAWVQECLTMTSHGGFDGCMVDRWTRNPFKNQPGYSEAAIAAYETAMEMSEAMLLNRTREAGVWLVGEGGEVDAISDPGYFGGTVAKGGNPRDSSIQMQMELAEQGQGLLASYKPMSTGSEFTNTLASFLIAGTTPDSFDRSHLS